MRIEISHDVKLLESMLTAVTQQIERYLLEGLSVVELMREKHRVQNRLEELAKLQQET